MAATTTSEVPDYAPAGNPMWLDVQSDTYITTAATPASVIIEVNAYPTAAQALVFTWDTDAIPFEFIAGSPDDSGLQINNGGATLGDCVDNIMAALSENYLFNKHFYLSARSGAGPYQFTVTAKEPGTEFNLTMYTNFSSITFPTNTPGVDEVVQPNFKLFTKVQIENLSNAWGTEEIIELSGTPTANSVSIPFTFEEALWPYLSPVRPTLGTSWTIESADAMILKYWLQFGEIYGTTPVGKTIQTTFPKWAIRAKQAFEIFPSNNFEADYITPLDVKFFTNQPRRKFVTKLQADWLYFYFPSAGSDIFLMANIYYTDGTQDLAVTLNNYVGSFPTPVNMYIAPTGYAQNKAVLESTAGIKTIEYYDVYCVDDGGGLTTETFTYVMDYKVYRNNNYLVYLNPLGGYDTIWCNGETQQSKHVDAETYQIQQNHDYTADSAAIKQLTNSSHREIIINTGWLKPKQQLIIAEFLESEDRMLYTPPITDDAAPTFLSIISLDKEAEQLNTANNQRAYTFRIRYAFND